MATPGAGPFSVCSFSPQVARYRSPQNLTVTHLNSLNCGGFSFLIHYKCFFKRIPAVRRWPCAVDL